MRLELKADEIIVWQTGSQVNKVEYSNKEDISKYKRSDLSYIELFLRKNNQIEEANKIMKYLGKLLRMKDIPQVIPTGNYNVSMPLNYLLDKIESFIKEDGLNLDPDFQRCHVWSMEQRIKFVEFILQGGKANPIYFNHSGWMSSWRGEFVIVDGKQRLTSLLMFLRNEFPVFEELDEDGIGFYAKEFDTLRTDIVYVINDLKDRKQVLKWYLNLNEGNIQHSKEEIEKVKELLKKEND